MKSLSRDRRKVWVSLYSTKQKIMSGTLFTGEWKVVRSEPFPIYPTLSASRGEASLDIFGANVDYDRVVTIDYINTGITETSVLWIDSQPAFDNQGRLITDNNGNPSVPFDYIVKRVAESQNVTLVAVKKVDQS